MLQSRDPCCYITRCSIAVCLCIFAMYRALLQGKSAFSNRCDEGSVDAFRFLLARSRHSSCISDPRPGNWDSSCSNCATSEFRTSGRVGARKRTFRRHFPPLFGFARDVNLFGDSFDLGISLSLVLSLSLGLRIVRIVRGHDYKVQGASASAVVLFHQFF